jgi:endonuclease I
LFFKVNKISEKMKKLLLIAYLSCVSIFAQQSYYNDVDLTLTGIALKNELATKITSTHTNTLSYSDAREALKIVDLDPGQTTNVLLLYGFSSGLCPANSGSDSEHRRRNKSSFGGGANCEWNREHTYPKSLGTPNLGTSGPGADAHHLRSTDVGRNGTRGSKRFADGSGNSGVVGSNWYPGDEWKGDVARMMMYMYLRYGNRCLPDNVGVGAAVANDANMIDLFLQWNAEDPVSTYEENRNNYLELTSNTYGQGNRNPFIDNPYFATKIWGGTPAEDIWGILKTPEINLETLITVYPNPAKDVLHINVNDAIIINEVSLYSFNGQLIKKDKELSGNKLDITSLSKGFYFVNISTNKGVLTKKVIVE